MSEKIGKTISTEVFTVKTQKDEVEKKTTKKSFFHIDKQMLRFKIHYFLFNGGTASMSPFIPVIAKNRLGLSASSLAAILASQQLITIISRPIIGYIADYFNRLKLIINTLLILQIAFLFLIFVIPPIEKPSNSLQEFDYIKNLNESSEFVILTARYSQNSKTFSSKANFSNSLTNKGNTRNEENHIFMDILCLRQIKSTTMVCFLKKIDKEIFNFNLECVLNCSCLIISSNSFNNTNDFSEYDSNMNFLLMPLDTSFSINYTNETFNCSIMPRENSEFSSDSSAVSTISDFQTFGFWMFAIVNIIAGICTASLFTLSDTACCESVHKLGGDFGRQRLYGAVGWGSLAAMSGILCDLTGNYFASWCFSAVLQIIGTWNLSQIDLIKPHFSQNLLKDVGRVFKSLELAAFELGVFLNGFGAGMLWFYLIWFLSGLGATKFLCGLTHYIQCFLGEIPFMFFSGWLIRKLGHFNLLSLSLLAYALRFLWYSYLQNPWLVLPAEIGHGFTYGTLFPAIASYAKMSAKPGTEATTQSILFTTHGGLGAGCGCIVAGVFFDRFGTHKTFFYFSMICFCATVLNSVNTVYFKRRKVRNINLPPDSTNKCSKSPTID